MKTLKLFLLITITILLFITCKKYPEGGWNNVAIKHLFGGQKTGSSKTWHLKKYEVNGIDSTEFIKPGNGVTAFQNDGIDFENRSSSSRNQSLYATTKLYEYRIDFVDKKKLSFTVFTNRGPDSTQCSASKCERNIFNPVKSKFTVFEWKIIKLKKDELIIISNKNNNNYRIILNN